MAAPSTFPFLPARWRLVTLDLAGDPQVFPRLIGQKFVSPKTQTWSTKVARSASGKERRRPLWASPTYVFKLDFDMLRTDANHFELETLFGFVGEHAGQALPFYYLDSTDNQATVQPFGTGDGTTLAFQLKRSWRGNPRYLEPVYAVEAPPQIYINGALRPASTYSLGSGLVTFSVAPAAGAVLTWTGIYMFLCCFDSDEFAPQRDFNSIWSLEGLTFRSLKS